MPKDDPQLDPKYQAEAVEWAKGYHHPRHEDLYTPITPEIIELIWRMRAEHGTWRRVAFLSNTRLKVLRRIRTGKRKAVSLRLLDRLCITTGVGSVEEFTWFTAEDLVALGIWKPTQYVDGTLRVKGQYVHLGDNKPKPKKHRPEPRPGNVYFTHDGVFKKDEFDRIGRLPNRGKKRK
jgi:hypothetical protein